MSTKKSVSTMRFASNDARKSLDPISCIFLCPHEICRRAQSLDFTALPAHSDMNGIYKNLPHICPMCPISAP